jgi:hypothetical protein
LPKPAFEGDSRLGDLVVKRRLPPFAATPIKKRYQALSYDVHAARFGRPMANSQPSSNGSNYID